jgi:hypothetical protein
MMSSLFSQSTIEGHAFRPYDDQWDGRGWSSSYQDRIDATWGDARYHDDDLPSLTESVAGLFARVRATFGR